MENLLSNTDKLKGKRKQIVEENGDMATLSKQLATIDRNVPLTVTLPELVKREPSPEELQALLQELEFRSMQAKLFGKKAPEPRKAPPPGRRFVCSRPPDGTAFVGETLRPCVGSTAERFGTNGFI